VIFLMRIVAPPVPTASRQARGERPCQSMAWNPPSSAGRGGSFHASGHANQRLDLPALQQEMPSYTRLTTSGVDIVHL